MWLKFVLPFLKRASTSVSRRRPIMQRHSFVPGLEVLESRTVPTTFTVANTLDSGAGSLRQAIVDANANPGPDTIAFAKTVHQVTLTGGELEITDNLSIHGTGANKLALSGNDASRVFHITSGATVTVAEVTISHGRADIGGAVLNEEGASLTIDGCTLSSNQSIASTWELGGGGALWNGGDATIKCSAFFSNQTFGESLGSGGAIENIAGTLIVTNTSFVGNRSIGVDVATSGALDNFYGQVTLTECSFTENQSIGTGPGAHGVAGAILSYDDRPEPIATMTISDCAFLRNKTHGGDGLGHDTGHGTITTSEASSGAIYNFGATMTITHSLIKDNQAIGGRRDPGGPPTDSGGGRLECLLGVVTVTDTTFRGNLIVGTPGGPGVPGALAGGGAIISAGAVLTVADCRFISNHVIGGDGGAGALGGTGDGGAIAIGTDFFGSGFAGSANITNCVFVDNTAQGGRGGSGASGGLGSGGAISLGHIGLLGRSDESPLTLTNCRFEHNTVRGGAGGSGGAGGDGWGGALAVLAEATAALDHCWLEENRAVGGEGRYGGDGGNGLGGGIYVGHDASDSIKKSTIRHNRAEGGEGHGGSDGLGVGAGVYNLGTFLFDAFTFIKKNHASTSDDDIFG